MEPNSEFNHSILKPNFSMPCLSDLSNYSTEESKLSSVPGSDKSEKSSGTSGEKSTTLIFKESKAVGEVTWDVFLFYINSCGGFYAISTLIILLSALSIALLVQNYYLAVWMNEMQRGTWRSGREALYDYIFLILVVFFLAFFQALAEILFSMKGCKVVS